MTIPDTCKLLSQNLSHNLRLAATDDDRRQCYTATMSAFCQQIIPPFNQLLNLHGEGSPEFDSARLAALDLATFICGGLVRTSKDYRAAITSIDELTGTCREPQLKAKLVFYTNQLKKRWNIAEPGGLSHNPRAKKIRAQFAGEPAYGKYIGGVLLLGVLCYLFTTVFPSQDSQERAAVPAQTRMAGQQGITAQESQRSQLQQAAAPAKVFYSYTDNQAVIHFVDVLDKVPLEYRRNMKADVSAPVTSSSTAVIIRGNQVIVPVTITFHGRTVAARLLLDTGASVTTIGEAVAAELGVGTTDVKSGKTTVADGRKVDSRLFKADSLAVSDRVLPNADISILPGSGGKGYDGLLGMNYLKNIRYHVNFESRVIEWGG